MKNDEDDNAFWAKVFIGGWAWGTATGLIAGFILGATIMRRLIGG